MPVHTSKVFCKRKRRDDSKECLELLAKTNPNIGIPNPNYDINKIPPSFEDAKKHALATRVHKPEINPNTELCGCCGLPVRNEPISFWFSNKDIEHLGICFPLYFTFLRSCMILLAVMSLGNYLIIGLNFSTLSDTSYHFIHKMTALPFILDYPHYKNTVLESTILNFVFILIFFIYFQVIRKKFKAAIAKYDADVITPGDFTIKISGLHGLNYTKKELTHFLCRHLSYHEGDPVRKIVFTYDLKPINELLTTKENLLKQKQNLENLMKEDKQDHDLLIKINKINEEYNEMSSKVENLISEYQKYDISQGAGTVFVSFNTKKMANIIKKKFKKSAVQRFFFKLINLLTFGLIFRDYFFKGRFPIIKRAPEPSDLIWENMKFGGSTLWFRRIRAHIFSILLLTIGFLALFSINYYKTYGTEDKLVEPGKTSKYRMGPITSIVSSLIITAINTIINITVRKISLGEKPKSYTYLARANAEKLIWTQFFNTAFLTFLTQAYLFCESQIHDSSINGFEVLKQFVNNMFFVFITSSITTPILNILDFSYFQKLVQQKELESQGNKCILTQGQVNDIFEGLPCDLAPKFSNIINIVYVCAFYAAYIPVGIPISLLGIVLNYYADKYVLTHRQSIPNEYGKDLPEAMIEYLEWFAFFYASGIFVYGLIIKLLYHENYVLYFGIIGSIISLVLVLVSSNALYKKIRSPKAKKEHLKYENVELIFESDYDRANPITKRYSEENYLTRRLALENDSKRKEEIIESLNYLKKMSTEEIIRNFQAKPRFEFDYVIKENDLTTKKRN